MSVDNQSDEYGAFFDRMYEIWLMVHDILLNPVPLSEQPGILKKLKILNYALGEWSDQFDRMQQRQQSKYS